MTAPLTKLWNNDGRRSSIERRQFAYTYHVPERRSGIDRRSGGDRRQEKRTNPVRFASA